MSTTSKKVQEAGLILGGLGVIGFLGIIWLMIYGNLGTAIVFPQTNTTTYVNESGYAINDTTYTLTGATRTAFRSLSVTVVHNATDGLPVSAANYTVDGSLGTITGAAGRSDNFSTVNISYTATNNEEVEEQTNRVIENMSGGFTTFFGFSNTFFTIAAIVLLIFMLLGLLALVMNIVQKNRGKSGGYSGY